MTSHLAPSQPPPPSPVNMYSSRHHLFFSSTRTTRLNCWKSNFNFFSPFVVLRAKVSIACKITITMQPRRQQLLPLHLPLPLYVLPIHPYTHHHPLPKVNVCVLLNNVLYVSPLLLNSAHRTIREDFRGWCYSTFLSTTCCLVDFLYLTSIIIVIITMAVTPLVSYSPRLSTSRRLNDGDL